MMMNTSLFLILVRLESKLSLSYDININLDILQGKSILLVVVLLNKCVLIIALVKLSIKS